MTLTDFIAVLIFMLSSPQLHADESRRMAADVHDAARSHGEDPLLFAALIADESHFNRRARSPAPTFAYGLGQLHPLYWGKGLEHTSDFIQLYRAAEALKHYRGQCGGGPWRAISAYRAGRCSPATTATTRVMKTFGAWSRRWREVKP